MPKLEKKQLMVWEGEGGALPRHIDQRERIRRPWEHDAPAAVVIFPPRRNRRRDPLEYEPAHNRSGAPLRLAV